MTRSRHIPPHARAVLDALHFATPRFDALRQLTDSGWRELISFCYRTQLALPFALRCLDRVPIWMADRFKKDLANNAARWRQTKLAYREVSGALKASGLEFVLLKGFTHVPAFVADPRHRAQYDLDLLLPGEQLFRVLDVVLELGYDPVTGRDGHPTDHLPTLIRKTGWQWRRDYFDPQLPLALELHFRLWDADVEGFSLPGLGNFWNRRERRTLEDLEFASLAPLDLLGYACAHALRHLLRGDLKASHIYELAAFLENNTDVHFWHDWRNLHDAPLRRVQAICCAIARAWFGCRVSPILEEEIAQLPAGVRAWLAAYAHAPLASLFHPNKDELWLHLSLLGPGVSRFGILRRRLMPLRLPGHVHALHVPEEDLGWRLYLRRVSSYVVFFGSRLCRHARALAPTLWSGAGWAWSRGFK